MSTELCWRQSVAEIQEAVAWRFRITPSEIRSRRRSRTAARPRQVAMWIARYTTPLSLTEIGWAFERDHTTVIHAIRQVDKMMAQDPDIAAVVWALLDAVDKSEAVALRRSIMRSVAA
jgi:chromosomal replication initiator protein